MQPIVEQVRALIDTYNRKQDTHRFCSVDEVARDLGMQARPGREVREWISRIAQAVKDAPPLAADAAREWRSRRPSALEAKTLQPWPQNDWDAISRN